MAWEAPQKFRLLSLININININALLSLTGTECLQNTQRLQILYFAVEGLGGENFEGKGSIAHGSMQTVRETIQKH